MKKILSTIKQKIQHLWWDIEQWYFHLDVGNNHQFIFGEGQNSTYITDHKTTPTTGDFAVEYDKKHKMYYLGIETGFCFEDHAGWIKWLEECLGMFTQYMVDHNLNVNKEFDLFFCQPKIMMKAETLEELYTNFRFFIAGYKSLYGGINVV